MINLTPLRLTTLFLVLLAPLRNTAAVPQAPVSQLAQAATSKGDTTVSAISRAQSEKLKRLVGWWEGEISRGSALFNPDRTLVIAETDGALTATYGVTGKELQPVTLDQVKLYDDETAKIKFRTPAGLPVTLMLTKGGWLDGSMRGSAGNDMPIKLIRQPK